MNDNRLRLLRESAEHAAVRRSLSEVSALRRPADPQHPAPADRAQRCEGAAKAMLKVWTDAGHSETEIRRLLKLEEVPLAPESLDAPKKNGA